MFQPSASGANRGSVLFGLQEIWAIDSRECPWVPELDDLTENPDPTQCTSTGILSAEALAHGSCSQHSAANGASGSKKGAALLQQSLFSAAMGSRSAVARLRSKYGSPACLEGVLLFSEYGHKDFPELMPVFDRLHQVGASSETGKLCVLPACHQSVQCTIYTSHLEKHLHLKHVFHQGCLSTYLCYNTHTCS
jgi:hypothetical protein